MSFISKIAEASFRGAMKNDEKWHDLEKSRSDLIKVVRTSKKKSELKKTLEKFRDAWNKYYNFKLTPAQEEMYLEVIRDQSGDSAK